MAEMQVETKTGLVEEMEEKKDDKKKRRRCMICVEFNCDKFAECPGNSNQKNCACEHKKVRRSCLACREQKCVKANKCAGRGGKKFHNCDCIVLSPEDFIEKEGPPKKKRKSRRCAVCIKYDCQKQYNCPGNANKKRCACGHKKTTRHCAICKKHGPCERVTLCLGKGTRKSHYCFCTSYELCPKQECKDNRKCTCEWAEKMRMEVKELDFRKADKKSKKRNCAVCLKFKCPKANECPGNANRNKCRCRHKVSKKTCLTCKKKWCSRMNICKGKGGARWHDCECDNQPVPNGPPFLQQQEIALEDGTVKKIKKRRRCTVCIKYNCDQCYTCPGNSNKKNCKCNHKKARRTCSTCRDNKCPTPYLCAGRGGKKYHNCGCSPVGVSMLVDAAQGNEGEDHAHGEMEHMGLEDDAQAPELGTIDETDDSPHIRPRQNRERGKKGSFLH